MSVWVLLLAAGNDALKDKDASGPGLGKFWWFVPFIGGPIIVHQYFRGKSGDTSGQRVSPNVGPSGGQSGTSSPSGPRVDPRGPRGTNVDPRVGPSGGQRSLK